MRRRELLRIGMTAAVLLFPCVGALAGADTCPETAYADDPASFDALVATIDQLGDDGGVRRVVTAAPADDAGRSESAELTFHVAPDVHYGAFSLHFGAVTDPTLAAYPGIARREVELECTMTGERDLTRSFDGTLGDLCTRAELLVDGVERFDVKDDAGNVAGGAAELASAHVSYASTRPNADTLVIDLRIDLPTARVCNADPGGGAHVDVTIRALAGRTTRTTVQVPCSGGGGCSCGSSYHGWLPGK